MAFAAPIGGLLLAIEEGSSFLSLSLFWRGFLATCTGVVTLHLLAQCHGDFGQILYRKFGLWRDLGWALLPITPQAQANIFLLCLVKARATLSLSASNVNARALRERWAQDAQPLQRLCKWRLLTKGFIALA